MVAPTTVARPTPPRDRRQAVLPTEPQSWPRFHQRRTIDAAGDDYDMAREELLAYAVGRPWVWPGQRMHFLCDVHADTDAFLRSLVASGGVERTGPEDTDFRLTAAGKGSVFVIGGDCFDKGPCNLRLLAAIAHLRRIAHVELLAGNHDVRALVGLAYLGRKEPHLAHLFVRMGRKSAPLFREIHDRYLQGPGAGESPLSDDEVRDLLFPPPEWYDEFAAAVAPYMPRNKIAHELQRIREKTLELEHDCARLGLTLSMVHAAALQARRLFFEPDGELHWFFADMKLACRVGSFLFVHAGVDDSVAAMLRAEGVDGLNGRFRRLLRHDLFELYHGALGNAFRTKYRDTDRPLTAAGVSDLHATGIYAIVHGHRNVLRGQRMLMREGILNFECDATLDSNTRSLVGLPGAGAAATVFEPTGELLGISVDHPYVKTLRAADAFGTLAIV